MKRTFTAGITPNEDGTKTVVMTTTLLAEETSEFESGKSYEGELTAVAAAEAKAEEAASTEETASAK